MIGETLSPLASLLARGGPTMWAIGALSVATLAIILWKIWHFRILGAWGARPGGAVGAIAAAAAEARRAPHLTDAAAREDVTRQARALIAESRKGLRALELIAAIAPLLGLLGTVLGMIAAFQALQDAGARPDASALAGGIWEALLTTAAGMSVAIPAAAALSWFEGVAERLQLAMEDAATRVFTQAPSRPAAVA